MQTLFTSVLDAMPSIQDDFVTVAKFVIGVCIAIAGAAFIRDLLLGGRHD